MIAGPSAGAHAQGAQGALLGRQAVFGVIGTDARPPGGAPAGCVDVFPVVVGLHPYSVGAAALDPMACDEVIPSDALDPGSGMVLVSARGERLSALPARRSPAVGDWPAWLGAAEPPAAGRQRYPASTGSAARERVAVAINPPPSTRAPR